MLRPTGDDVMRAYAINSAAPPFAGKHKIVRARRRATVHAPVAPANAPVPAFEFSTLDLPPQEQFAAWRHSFAPIVHLAEPDDLMAGFAGTQIVWDLGNLAFSWVKTESLSFASRAGHIRRDPIDHWLLTLILEGRSKTIAPSRTFDAGAGSVQVLPLGKVFEGRVTDSEVLLLFVPRDFCRSMAHVLDAAEFSTLDRGMGRLFADYMTSIAQRLPTLDATELPGLVSATRAMILACDAPSRSNIEGATEPIAAALLERARSFIQANLIDPTLDVTSLLRELAVSRSRLYRLFEPSGGVLRYIQHRRLLDAHAALANPDDHRRILDIAEERGFSGGAEFSRAFKREFGYSPSDVRTSGKSAPPSRRPDADLPTTAPHERLGVLLRRLQA
jgi:AraC-like DNA-binding protein